MSVYYFYLLLLLFLFLKWDWKPHQFLILRIISYFSHGKSCRFWVNQDGVNHDLFNILTLQQYLCPISMQVILSLVVSR